MSDSKQETPDNLTLLAKEHAAIVAALRQQVADLTRENAAHESRHQANKRIKEGLIRERDSLKSLLARCRRLLRLNEVHNAIPLSHYDEYDRLVCIDHDEVGKALAPPPAERTAAK